MDLLFTLLYVGGTVGLSILVFRFGVRIMLLIPKRIRLLIGILLVSLAIVNFAVYYLGWLTTVALIVAFWVILLVVDLLVRAVRLLPKLQKHKRNSDSS